MYNRQNDLDQVGSRTHSWHQTTDRMQRLDNLDKSFAGLESRAEAFNAAQNAQAELQTRLYDQMQTEMYVAHGLLADITSSATYLQATLDDTTSKVASMTMSGSFTSRSIQLGLVLYCLHLFKPRFAAIAAAVFGGFSVGFLNL